MRAASGEHGWDLDLGTIASIWRAGCIIRADFLEDITAAYRENSEVADVTETEFFASALAEAEAAWRNVVGSAVAAGVPGARLLVRSGLLRLDAVAPTPGQPHPGPT